MRDFSEGKGGGRAGGYRRTMRGIVRALWAGVFDFGQSYELMLDTVRLGLTNAWYAGAASVGITPTELSVGERRSIEDVIHSEQSHIEGFLDAVQAGSKANGGKLRPQLQRVEMWANRYNDVMNRARTEAASDPKLQWTLGPTKTHCSSCYRLAGKTKRAKTWHEQGILPQNPVNEKLECKGFNCLCALLPTDEPLSKGPLPNLP